MQIDLIDEMTSYVANSAYWSDILSQIMVIGSQIWLLT